MSLVYPFSAIVAQEEMKLALLIAAVDPTIGGVLIFGDRGSGKSTAVLASLHTLASQNAQFFQRRRGRSVLPSSARLVHQRACVLC